MTNELLRWFDQQNIKIVAEVEKMLLSSSGYDKETVVLEVAQSAYQQREELKHT